MSTILAIIILITVAWSQHRASNAGVDPETRKKLEAWRASAGLDGRHELGVMLHAVAVAFVLWCFKPDELPLIILAMIGGGVITYIAKKKT